MRILQAGSGMAHDWGGIERYLAYLCPMLESQGHQVTLARPKGSPLAEKTPHVKGVDLHLRRRWDVTAAAAYLRLFRSQPFDLVASHFSPDYLMPAWAARRCGVKTLMTRHVVIPFKSNRAAAYARLYDGFLGVSEAVAESLRASGLPSDRVVSAITGIPPLSGTAKRTGDGFCVGFFGRLVRDKGVEYAIEASRKTGVTLNIFGAGPDEARLKKLAEGSPAVFHGYSQSVADLMLGQDAVVIPSTWQEAMPIAVIEAMSLGLAITASRVGGIPEIIRSGENGLLFPKEDAGAIAQAWEMIRTDQALGQQLGQKAKRDYESRLTLEAAAVRIDAAYRTLAT